MKLSTSAAFISWGPLVQRWIKPNTFSRMEQRGRLKAAANAAFPTQRLLKLRHLFQAQQAQGDGDEISCLVRSQPENPSAAIQLATLNATRKSMDKLLCLIARQPQLITDLVELAVSFAGLCIKVGSHLLDNMNLIDIVPVHHKGIFFLGVLSLFRLKSALALSGAPCCAPQLVLE